MYNAYLKLLPLPNTATPPGVEPFNNLRTQGDPDPITNSIWFNRFDYNLNEKHRFFLRWSYSHFTERLGTGPRKPCRFWRAMTQCGTP